MSTGSIDSSSVTAVVVSFSIDDVYFAVKQVEDEEMNGIAAHMLILSFGFLFWSKDAVVLVEDITALVCEGDG